MTKTELRIAVAKAVGYEKKLIRYTDEHNRRYEYMGWVNEKEYRENFEVKLPNYPDSMDACMELVEEMTNGTGLFLEIHVASTVGDTGDLTTKYYVALRKFDYDYPTVEEMPIIAECTDETMSGAVCWIFIAWKEGE